MGERDTHSRAEEVPTSLDGAPETRHEPRDVHAEDADQATGRHDTSADASAAGHGHDASGGTLGPVDTRAWAAAIGGAVLATLVILALYVAVQG